MKLIPMLCGLLFSCVATCVLADTPPIASASVTEPSSDAAPALPIGGESTLSRIDRTKVLRVGVAVNAPWVMHDKEGQWMGYEIDVAKRLAAAMEWKLEFVGTSWPRLLTDLRTNQFDLVASGLSITPQRALLVRFSQPYGEYDIDVVVNKSKLPSGGIRELGQGTRKIGARKGMLTVQLARGVLPASSVVEMDDEEQAIADLREGKLDAYVVEAPLPSLLTQLYPDQLRILGGDPLARTAHGMAVRRADSGLLDIVNAWIVFEQANGWLKNLADYWLNGTQWADRL